jgi:hypothetical protein
MRRLRPCLAALRVLASSKTPLRRRLIELEIDEYLKKDPLSLARGLERLRVAIHNEETERREVKIGASRGNMFAHCCAG